ncbi:MAG: Sapep family Mn(2+)-dependent dipeptidase [Myxococcaceae bacterium]
MVRGLFVALTLSWSFAASAAPDPRCEGGITRAAKHFSARAPELKGRSDLERYRAFVQACARDEVIALTTRLVSFRTVSSEAPAPANPHIQEMGRFLRAWAKSHGMGFRAVNDGDVFELAWGAPGGEARLGLVFHGDVVPAPRHEWSRDPFQAEVVDGKLYGRGVEDDKGPLASALVSLAMANAIGLQPQGRVLVIVGNGEESNWSGMRLYAEQAPKMTHIVSVDSSFPLVAAQSGFVAWTLEADVGEEVRGKTPGLVATGVKGGEFLTQVPGQATLTLSPRGLTSGEAEARIHGAIAELTKSRPQLRVELTRRDGQLLLTAHGRAVHSSGAEEGHNALWDLSALAAQLPLRENGISAMLGVIARRFDGDHYGKKLGLAYEDPFMGPLLVAPTVLRVDGDKVRLLVNMRRPMGRDNAAFRASLDRAAAAIAEETGGRVKEGGGRSVGDPHAADTSGPLATTLLDIYGQVRGVENPKAIAIRGGTYARLFPRAVDFGPNLPGEPYTGHAPDESISLEALDAVTTMLSEAVWRLAVAE